MTTDMMSEEQYDAETHSHVALVQQRLLRVQDELRYRGLVHDFSKSCEPERSGFRRIAGVQYGTPEYEVLLHEGFVQHHYARNGHHPEHYANGVAGMSLLDVVEMLCDWSAASEQRMGKKLSEAGTLQQSFERFGVEPQLAAIILNTVKELEW